MKKIITLFLFALLSFQNFTGTAQIDTCFWFACPWVTPDHTFRHDYKLHISSFNSLNTVVRLRQPGAIAPNKYDTTINIPANSNFDYTFWRDKLASTTNRGFDSLEVQPADVVLPYGLYISSSAEITVVYDVITNPPTFYNPETFSMKGQNGLGLNFMCPFQTKWHNQLLGNLAGTQPGVNQPKQQINIVASQPNTIVWITPKTAVVGHPANVAYSITLTGYGSAYTVENLVQNTDVAGNNLAGTLITSNKPIAVTVADDSVDGLTGCYDLMGDQIVPIDVVGTEYVLIKGHMNPSEPDGGFILGTVNSTSVIIDDGVVTTTIINVGQTFHYHTTQPLTHVSASSPVYVLHATGVGNGCELGEALVPPLNCAGSNLVTFSRNTPQSFFLNLLCKAGSETTFTLNNSSSSANVPITSANFTVVPGTSGQFYGAQINLNSTAILPIGSFTVGNNTDVFAMGVLDGGASTGGLYHYLSSFLKPTSVSAGNSFSLCVNTNSLISLSGTITGAANTGIWTTPNGTGAFGIYTSTLNTVSTDYTLSNADLLLGSVKFILTSAGGCVPKKDSIIVTLIPPPQLTVSPSSTICNSYVNPIALSATVANSAGGTWNSSGTGFFIPSNSVPNASYSPSAADVSGASFTLTYNATGLCGSVLGNVIYTVITTPTVAAITSTSLICVGQNATLTASGANTYTWNTSSTNTAIVVSPANTTTYSVTGAINGCFDTDTLTQNVSLCTGIIENNGLKEDLIMIYPNPNNGEFTIRFAVDVKLTLTNELGQVVKVISLNNSNNRNQSITHLANGIYFISGKVNNQRVNQKIVVTK